MEDEYPLSLVKSVYHLCTEEMCTGATSGQQTQNRGHIWCRRECPHSMWAVRLWGAWLWVCVGGYLPEV